MKFAPRLIIALFLLGIVITSVMGCAGCRKQSSDRPTRQPAETETPLPPELSENLTGELTDTKFSIGLDGQRAWSAEVKSGTIRSQGGKQVFLLTGLKCRHYRQGREVLEVSADTGTATRVGKTLRTELVGHIQAIARGQQQRLTAERFSWVSTDDVIHVTRFTWAGTGSTLSANQGTVSTDLTRLTFKGNARLETTDALVQR